MDSPKVLNRVRANVAGVGPVRAGHRARRTECVALRPHACAPSRSLDRQQRHARRHDGQQLRGARRSSSKTSTPCSSRTVVRDDGFAGALGPVDDAEAERRGAAPTLEVGCYESLQAHARRNWPELERGTPRCSAGWADKTWKISWIGAPFTCSCGAGWRARGRGGRQPRGSGAVPTAKSCWRSSFTIAGIAGGDAANLRHTPSRRMMDKSIIDHTRQARRSKRAPSLSPRTRGAAVGSSTATAPRICRREARVKRPARARLRRQRSPQPRPGRPGRIWSLREEGAGLSRAMRTREVDSFVEDTAGAPTHGRFTAVLALVRSTAPPPASRPRSRSAAARAAGGHLSRRPGAAVRAIANTRARSGARGRRRIRRATVTACAQPVMRKMFGPAISMAFRDNQAHLDRPGSEPGRSSTPPIPTTGFGAATSRRAATWLTTGYGGMGGAVALSRRRRLPQDLRHDVPVSWDPRGEASTSAARQRAAAGDRRLGEAASATTALRDDGHVPGMPRLQDRCPGGWTWRVQERVWR